MRPPSAILIVEDDPAHAEATRRALSDGTAAREIKLASTLAEARQIIADSRPLAVIADLNLADGKAYDLLQANGGLQDYPMLVMTSQGDEQMAVQAMKSGAMDYVVKTPETFASMPRLLDRILREYSTMVEGALALEALRQSEGRLSNIIEFLPDATFAVDTDGRVIAWNQAMVRLTGFAKADVIGQDVRGFVHAFHGTEQGALVDLILDPDLEDAESLYDALERSDDRVIAELYNPRLNGGEGAHLWMIASPLLDSDGRRVGAIESVRDITQSKRAQEAMLRRHGESRAITEVVNDKLYMVDLQGRLCWWNKRLELDSGRSPDELRTAPITTFFHPDDAPRVKSAFQAALLDGYGEVEARAITVRGVRPHRYNGVTVRNEAGEVIGIAGIGQDITDQLHDQERLRLAATVLASTREGVLVTDANANRTVSVNHAFTEITGYTEAEILDNSPKLLKSGRHDREFYRLMWASIEQTGHWQGEIWNRRKSGELFPAWLTISAVRDEQGRLTNYVGVMSDISQVKQSEAKLAHLAHYDPLTELPNRLLLHSRLEHAIDRAKRFGFKVGVLFIDLDRFKHVNDSLGHPVGDELLQAVANRLSKRMRRDDTLARLGGDEFVVVLEQIEKPEDAGHVAELIIGLLEQPFRVSQGRELHVGASIGISLYPNNGHDVIELLRNADTVMYQAKAQGRNTYRYYTESLTHAATERLSLESQLRRALERDELTLHYQPQVSMANDSIVGLEALVRWTREDGKVMLPEQFVPLAEETGLIAPMSEWVLYNACRQMRTWLDQGLPEISVAVNLSAQQFAQRDLADRVERLLNEVGVPAVCLELELTESMIMRHNEQTLDILNALRNLGVTISIDDFGTGYSSLAYLKRLPIDKLKIDRSFVQGIPEDRNDAEIAATVIAMARNLRLRVLAEGVETPEQCEFLRSAGCDAYQGFYFSRPMKPEAIPLLCRGHAEARAVARLKDPASEDHPTTTPKHPA